MSVKVDLDQLAEALADFTFAYLVTVSDDHLAHTVAVEPALDDGVFDIGTVGKRTRGNAAQHPGVTLIYPPADRGGYTLIVDGRAELTGEQVRVVAQHAVLHRPAVAGLPTASGCGDDCVPLDT